MSSPGSRNLLILSVGAILIASITTVVSLTLYNNSGDIYLDRSRPGFLPDKEEIEEVKKPAYTFPDTGSINQKTLDQYLKEIQTPVKNLDNLKTPFSEESLSDKSLGI